METAAVAPAWGPPLSARTAPATGGSRRPGVVAGLAPDLRPPPRYSLRGLISVRAARTASPSVSAPPAKARVHPPASRWPTALPA